MTVDIFGSSTGVTKEIIDKRSLIKNFLTKVNKSGDIMSGDLDMGGYKISNEGDPRGPSDVVNKRYMQACIENENEILLKLIDFKVDKVAAKLEGDLNMNGHGIYNLKDPVDKNDVVTKKYMQACLLASKQDVDEARTTVDNFNSLLTYYTLSTVGLIPFLTSSYDVSGYTVMTSSDTNNTAGFKAFNPQRNSAWRAADDFDRNDFWIAIRCIDPVKIYKFTARAPLTTKLKKWKLQGGNDPNPDWKDLSLTPTIPIEDGITYTFNIQEIKLAKEYQWYRIFVEEAEGENPGLTYWQLYTVNQILLSKPN